MKLFKTTAYAFAAAVAMCAFSACGGDDDDNGGITPPDPRACPAPREGSGWGGGAEEDEE